MYKILPYTQKRAKELKVIIKPSTNKLKKIDVFTPKGEFIASIGDIRYLDYPNYVLKLGKQFADERKRLYLIRHKNDTGKAGFYAKKLLW
jgi:hypothetical protein